MDYKVYQIAGQLERENLVELESILYEEEQAGYKLHSIIPQTNEGYCDSNIVVLENDDNDHIEVQIVDIESGDIIISYLRRDTSGFLALVKNNQDIEIRKNDTVFKGTFKYSTFQIIDEKEELIEVLKIYIKLLTPVDAN
ncbi:hypothetical protein [Cytobacillus sp. IB215665]|uniref:hypothetical protein n=1 Tax=Cytobacillus sp. IB215665 TaxID=3097357 RepID=UPI002A0BA353|nr:hypothetical protein [Cytobacillus sp. IB215665]MDX8366665.1 hypothetical protein [Cytobacillus sp. IB215665]